MTALIKTLAIAVLLSAGAAAAANAAPMHDTNHGYNRHGYHKHCRNVVKYRNHHRVVVRRCL